MNKYIIFKQTPNLDNIKTLTKTISINRPIESTNLKNIKMYVLNKLKEIGLKIVMQEFTQIIKNKTYVFSNLIAYNTNSINKYILLGAHIDSIENCNGAIDSASSIAIILELARCILKYKPNYPLMIVFFDGEEAIDGKWSKDNTLIGSKYFVNNYDTTNIECLYLLDLIGGSINDNKIVAFCNNPKSYNKIKKMHEINKSYDQEIFINPDMKVSYKNIDDDHIPFAEKGIDNLNFIPDVFPFQHHKISDKYENLNWTYIDIFTKVFYEYLTIIK
jgi:hypothetical protein